MPAKVWSSLADSAARCPAFTPITITCCMLVPSEVSANAISSPISGVTACSIARCFFISTWEAAVHHSFNTGLSLARASIMPIVCSTVLPRFGTDP